MKTKKKCDLAPYTHMCSGQAIRTYKGRAKNDPKFNACIACAAIMRMRGVKFSEVKAK